ncbi:MAG: nucleoside 2-deoxyribosyltransferase [Planctomycetes bacterium]|nr:nucleoside 2-deoxyribosyltransferase [Planctomycetota bacterium]
MGSKATNTIYLAAPLFSQMERQWNRGFAEELEKNLPEIEILLPQDFRIEGKFNSPEHFGEIFQKCIEGVRASAAVVAILDGDDVDSGVALEIGLAYALKIPVIGVRTDYRDNQEKGVNLMISRACTFLVREFSFREDLPQLAASVSRRLIKVLPG